MEKCNEVTSNFSIHDFSKVFYRTIVICTGDEWRSILFLIKNGMVSNFPIEHPIGLIAGNWYL